MYQSNTHDNHTADQDTHHKVSSNQKKHIIIAIYAIIIIPMRINKSTAR